MSAASRAKGARWQRAVRDYLRFGGLSVVDTGGAGYEAGDLLVLGSPNIAVEAKDQQKLALASWLDQATRQAPAGSVPVVVHHRKGKASVADAYVTMSGASLLRLLEGR